MRSHHRAFVLLVILCLAASGFALLMRSRNELEDGVVQPKQEQMIPRPIALIPTTSTPDLSPSVKTPSIPTVPVIVFSSKDHVTSVILSGYPNLYPEFHIYGTSTAFENQIRWRVRDLKRAILGEGPIQLKSPDAGFPGSFDADVLLDRAPSSESSGTLFVFEPSPKDGTPTHIVEIPVRFRLPTSIGP